MTTISEDADYADLDQALADQALAARQRLQARVSERRSARESTRQQRYSSTGPPTLTSTLILSLTRRVSHIRYKLNLHS